MRISVITACFNSASTLESTLESFRSQVYTDKEIIVIDGGSTDGTPDIIKSSEGIIQKWVSEPDLGIYDALNKGIKIASGEVIGFLHSGDQFSNENVLEKIAEYFQSKNADALYGDLLYVKKGKRERIVRTWKSGSFYPGILQKGWMPPHPTFYLKKEIYEKQGLFDLDFRISADYEMMLRLLKNPTLKIEYIPKVLVEMETGGTSNKSLGNIFRKSKEDYRALRKNGISCPLWVLGRKNFSKFRQFLPVK